MNDISVKCEVCGVKVPSYNGVYLSSGGYSWSYFTHLHLIRRGEVVNFYPDLKLFTEPKSFASQNIACIFPGMVICVYNGKLYVAAEVPGSPLPGGACLESLSYTALRCWVMVVYSKLWTNYFFSEFVLSWRRREDSASRIETLGYFPWAKRPQKPIFNCVGWVCRIVSV